MDQPEPLLLKVMRLRQPSTMAPTAAATVLDVPKLALPMALTQSLVGEPFTGYLHVSNVSAAIVRDVSLKVELQIGTSKYTLYNNSVNPVATLPPGEFVDALVEHSLRDAGTYVLSCYVSYSLGSSGEQAQFKRSYRFPALQPFAVSHRVVQLDRQLLVECAVENATSGSIYLSSWQLDCPENLEGRLLPRACDEDEGSEMQLLKQRGSHSLVFSVTPRDESMDIASIRELDFAGSLSLGWHVPDGPSGCMEGHQIRLKPLQAPGLDLQVVKCPKQVEVEVPFQLELEVINCTSAVVEPKVTFDVRLMGAVKVQGATQRTLSNLEPGSRQRLRIELLVTVPGLHGLQGIFVSDSAAQTKTEVGVLCDILAF
eukprot:gb/GFBE01054100.1/.p1 GENE.gb/GFBE01054100.1/~~gb/GFBE01054100.1/.p1  ORF type:complete len:371 (+),score=78.12 gb/GFBE01054100.1/:1-1113(+)